MKKDRDRYNIRLPCCLDALTDRLLRRIARKRKAKVSATVRAAIHALAELEGVKESGNRP